MTSTFTPNLNLQLQGVGDNANTWGTILNSAVFTNIDMALGSSIAPSVAGNTDFVLNATQALNLYHNPTGTLTGNINYIFPANCARILLFNNGTSGNFSLTVKSSGGTGIVLPQGAIVWVYINSTGNIATLPFGTTCYQNIASATTTDIGSTQSQMVQITGTTTITSLGSSASQTNPLYQVIFGGALTLTNNATSLILPGSANILTAANDSALFLYLGSGNWQCVNYSPASGLPVISPTIGTSGTWTPVCTAGTITFNFASYVKVGKSVTINFDITMPSSVTATQANITGLPFAIADGYVAGSIGFTDASIISMQGGANAATTLGVAFRISLGGGFATFANLSSHRIIATMTYIST